jgi:hypothetical protein
LVKPNLGELPGAARLAPANSKHSAMKIFAAEMAWQLEMVTEFQNA